MSEIKPGTPCYLTALADFPELTGRVVEIVGPWPAPDGEAGAWYQHRSEWARELFPGCETIAPRRNLRPIVPPELAPPEARKRTPQTVSR